VTRGLVSCQAYIFIRACTSPSDTECQNKSSSTTIALKLGGTAARTLCNRANLAKEQFLMLSVQYMTAIDPLTECVLKGIEVFLKKTDNVQEQTELLQLFSTTLTCVCVCIQGIILRSVSPAFVKQKKCQSSNTIFFLLIEQEDAINFQEREGLVMFPLPLQTH